MELSQNGGQRPAAEMCCPQIYPTNPLHVEHTGEGLFVTFISHLFHSFFTFISHFEEHPMVRSHFIHIYSHLSHIRFTFISDSLHISHLIHIYFTFSHFTFISHLFSLLFKFISHLFLGCVLGVQL